MAAIARVARPLRSSVLSSPAPPSLVPRLSANQVSTLKMRSNAAVGRTFRSSALVREKKYTTDHEWIELSDDGATGTIGISTYAAHSLGDVVYVELPTPDLTVSAGDSIGAVESVKSASDIMTPVAGTIIEANSLLEEKPGTINKGPEGEGWIARIKLEGQEERERVGGLMGGDEYRKFTEE